MITHILGSPEAHLGRTLGQADTQDQGSAKTLTLPSVGTQTQTTLKTALEIYNSFLEDELLVKGAHQSYMSFPMVFCQGH